MFKNKCKWVNFYFAEKRFFFLKFLEKKNILKIETKNETIASESIDLKELLDEKKVKIKFSDIITDYRYFRREYYFYTPGDYDKKYFPNEHRKKDLSLPWNKDETNLSNVFHYLLIKEKFSWAGKLIIFAIICNILSFLLRWKYNRYNRAHVEMLEKFDLSEKSKEEKNKNLNMKKWNF